MKKGTLTWFNCQECGRRVSYIYTGGRKKFYCPYCKNKNLHFTRINHPGVFDFENFPSINCQSYMRKQGPYIRIRASAFGEMIDLYSSPITDEETAKQIKDVINNTTDNTKIINGLLGIVRGLLDRTWQHKFYQQFAKREGYSNYYRFKYLPRFINKATGLRTLRQEIINLKRRIEDGTDRD